MVGVLVVPVLLLVIVDIMASSIFLVVHVVLLVPRYPCGLLRSKLVMSSCSSCSSLVLKILKGPVVLVILQVRFLLFMLRTNSRSSTRSTQNTRNWELREQQSHWQSGDEHGDLGIRQMYCNSKVKSSSEGAIWNSHCTTTIIKSFIY